jgi:hypothetical protein
MEALPILQEFAITVTIGVPQNLVEERVERIRDFTQPFARTANATRAHLAEVPADEPGLSELPSARRGIAADPRSQKSPSRFMFLFWGLPLLLFIIIAVVKQCGSN